MGWHLTLIGLYIPRPQPFQKPSNRQANFVPPSPTPDLLDTDCPTTYVVFIRISISPPHGTYAVVHSNGRRNESRICRNFATKELVVVKRERGEGGGGGIDLERILLQHAYGRIPIEPDKWRSYSIQGSIPCK